MARLVGHLAIKTNYLHTRQIMAHANLKVGRVMRGRHLDRPCAKRSVDHVVRHNWYFALHDWQNSRAPNNVFVTWVFRIYGNGSITQDRFGARRSDANILRLCLALDRFERIAY